MWSWLRKTNWKGHFLANCGNLSMIWVLDEIKKKLLERKDEDHWLRKEAYKIECTKLICTKILMVIPERMGM